MPKKIGYRPQVPGRKPQKMHAFLMTAAQLRKQCLDHGIDTLGTKRELLLRLVEHLGDDDPEAKETDYEEEEEEEVEEGEEKMVVEEKPELDINEENYHKRMAEAAEKSGQQEKAMLCDSATADVLSVTGDFGDMPELKDVSEHPDNDHVMDTSDNVGGDNEGDGEEINQVFTGELIKEENVEENINENYEDLHQEAMGDIEAIADNDGDNEDDSDEDYIPEGEEEEDDGKQNDEEKGNEEKDEEKGEEKGEEKKDGEVRRDEHRTNVHPQPMTQVSNPKICIPQTEKYLSQLSIPNLSNQIEFCRNCKMVIASPITLKQMNSPVVTEILAKCSYYNFRSTPVTKQRGLLSGHLDLEFTLRMDIDPSIELLKKLAPDIRVKLLKGCDQGKSILLSRKENELSVTQDLSEVNKKKHMVCAVGVSRNWTDKVARQYFPGCTTLYKELERFKSKSPVRLYVEYATEQEAKDVVLNSEHFQNRGNKIHLFLLSDLPPFEDPTKDEVLPFKRGVPMTARQITVFAKTAAQYRIDLVVDWETGTLRRLTGTLTELRQIENRFAADEKLKKCRHLCWGSYWRFAVREEVTRNLQDYKIPLQNHYPAWFTLDVLKEGIEQIHGTTTSKRMKNAALYDEELMMINAKAHWVRSDMQDDDWSPMEYLKKNPNVSKKVRRKREAEIKQLLQKREERLESQSVQKKIDANPPKKKYGKWKERQCSHKGKARYQQRKADRSKGGKPFGAAPTRLSGTLAPLMIEERGKTDTPFDLLLGLNEVLSGSAPIVGDAGHTTSYGASSSRGGGNSYSNFRDSGKRTFENMNSDNFSGSYDTNNRGRCDERVGGYDKRGRFNEGYDNLSVSFNNDCESYHTIGGANNYSDDHREGGGNYIAGNNAYGARNNSYGAGNSNYGARNNSYGAGNSNYGARNNSYGGGYRDNQY